MKRRKVSMETPDEHLQPQHYRLATDNPEVGTEWPGGIGSGPQSYGGKRQPFKKGGHVKHRKGRKR